MNLGFLGTGEISSAIVTGLSATGDKTLSIRLSPRNREVAAALAARFPRVSVASSNQDVLDASDTVVLAVRPPIARAVLAELRFRADHRVISVVSGLPLASLLELIAPATQVTRAVPLPSTAQRLGPTTICPPDAFVAGLFASIGTVYPLETEAAFDAISAATGTVASFYVFMEVICSWLARNGIPEPMARDYVARLFLGETSAASDLPQKSFQSLATAHTTPGGINEQFLRYLSERGLLASVPDGLDQILERIRPRT